MLFGSVPILMYHRVTPEDLSVYSEHWDTLDALIVTPESFTRQMAWLAGMGFRTLTLSDLLDARQNQRAIPRRSVVITFDDGYQDFVDYAVPALSKFGFTAHIFLVAGLVGQNAEWDRRSYGWTFSLFDWETARDLEARGFHCDAHSRTHPPLGTLGEDESRHEIVESRRILSEELGREVGHFAYPFGSYTEETKAIVREAGFRSACSVGKGLSPVDDDPYALRRVWIHRSDTLFDFASVMISGRPLYSGSRRRVRRLLQR